ncbi:3-ketoacyl-ACP reductase [Paraburkholderia acidisoli]|uniref:3-ketoacyl-ACP reductase n=1 Tax=Paraburkholderia acidisoli TaxID=2571748 RepID=A0A7Z2GMK1_9BURK|nr:3-ketoacyl-ACP reductase [Paraburkholderia acidisoli]QGZ64285.1 3-ketoacyl-ACP reductase [Paraburkholderia acidisoli]
MTTHTATAPGESRPVALVTGAARGIGAAIALQLAKRGFDVALADLRFDDGDALRASIEATGARADLFVGDIARLDEHEALLAQVLAWAAKPLDCLVNNAGVAPEQRVDLLEMSAASFDRVLDINLRGTLFLTQCVARHMAGTASEHARAIVSVSSVSAEMASPERAEYCVSKAGIAMLTKLFAVRLAPLGIGVFEVRPGIIATPMTQAVAEKYTKRIEEGLVPAARWGQPEDVARAVAALADGSFGFATGSVVNVDGALSVARL